MTSTTNQVSKWQDVLGNPELQRHRDFLTSALPLLQQDERLVGVGAGGSFISGALDSYSDLDLVLAVEPYAYEEVAASKQQIAAELGPLLSAFTGEHLGELRLLICLYGPPLLHVDLKFVSLDDLHTRVEDPAILWERNGRLSQILQLSTASYPQPNWQWIEDRFWVWTHYLAAKIARGELFEAMDGLAFLRGNVIGPLLLQQHGLRPSGVRRIETVPTYHEQLRGTVATYDKTDCTRALFAAVQLYQELRGTEKAAFTRREACEQAVIKYLEAELQ